MKEYFEYKSALPTKYGFDVTVSFSFDTETGDVELGDVECDGGYLPVNELWFSKGEEINNLGSFFQTEVESYWAAKGDELLAERQFDYQADRCRDDK